MYLLLPNLIQQNSYTYDIMERYGLKSAKDIQVFHKEPTRRRPKNLKGNVLKKLFNFEYFYHCNRELEIRFYSLQPNSYNLCVIHLASVLSKGFRWQLQCL